MDSKSLARIVIIGGGAGGLELATQLGHSLGKKNQANIILVDISPTHIWKPLLHEVAAGVLDANRDELSYLAHARNNYYQFEWGRFTNLNRAERYIFLDSVYDENKNEIIPKRKIDYDVLIIAVGSVTADFNVPGVEKYCLFLDSRIEADRFQQQLLANLFRTHYFQIEPEDKKPLSIAIVGGGATGVELAAELRHTLKQASIYGLSNFDFKKDIEITIIEAADRILSALPKRISTATQKILDKLGIRTLTAERVVEVSADGLKTASGKFIPAMLKVWAAGIKAPAFLKELDGLAVNRLGQLEVKSTLQTTWDEHIFVLGDCASCMDQNTGKPLPPRAQVAHQQASFLVKAIKKYLVGKKLPNFVYHDYGSLVSLSKYDAVGNLMGRLTSVMIEGKIARFVYVSLYKMHQLKLYGFWRATLLGIANILTGRVKPKLKLH